MTARHSSRGPAVGRRRDERGQSVNAFVVGVLGAMLLTAGLVIDGGQQVTATSRAETTAAGAARAGANAAATEQLAGRDSAGVAVRAARAYLAGVPGVTGTASVRAGLLTVDTQAESSTVFLSLIGITQVRGSGRATASVVPTGEDR